MKETGVTNYFQQQNLAHQLNVLKSFKARKGMYISTISIDTVQSFLTGMSCARGIGGHAAWWEAQRRRGWKRNSAGPVPQMRDKGMTDEEIMDELIEIDIDVLERYLGKGE